MGVLRVLPDTTDDGDDAFVLHGGRGHIGSCLF